MKCKGKRREGEEGGGGGRFYCAAQVMVSVWVTKSIRYYMNFEISGFARVKPRGGSGW